jgi:hypothetical protein
MNDKDQAAIDHVASVSKHPHAAMIVKQLITGWSVEFEYAVGEWKISDYPSWAYDIKYRLIEPKPAKPAYRVYKLTETTTTTIDRGLDTIPDDVEWLGDWIEYDPPKKWPTPLVERIAAIDIKAAEWIVDHWDDLLDDRYTYKNNYSRDCGTLNHMFDWEATPQGSKYWESISVKLGE